MGLSGGIGYLHPHTFSMALPFNLQRIYDGFLIPASPSAMRRYSFLTPWTSGAAPGLRNAQRPVGGRPAPRPAASRKAKVTKPKATASNRRHTVITLIGCKPKTSRKGGTRTSVVIRKPLDIYTQMSRIVRGMAAALSGGFPSRLASRRQVAKRLSNAQTNLVSLNLATPSL